MRHLVKKILKYTVVFEPADEGGYVAIVPALPGCATQGETFEETVEMVRDAIQGYLTVMKKQGQEIPVEKNETVITKVGVPNPVYSAA